MRSFFLRFFSLIAILSFFLCGCGYTNRSQLPEDVRTIYVPTFGNAIPLKDIYTYEAGLETKVTNAIIDRLIFDGNLKVVDTEDRADVVLLGNIIRYEQEPVGFNRDEGVQEYRLFIVTDLTLKKLSDDSIMWVEPNFSGTSNYYTGGTNREDSTNRAIEDLANNVVNRIIEDW